MSTSYSATTFETLKESLCTGRNCDIGHTFPRLWLSIYMRILQSYNPQQAFIVTRHFKSFVFNHSRDCLELMMVDFQATKRSFSKAHCELLHVMTLFFSLKINWEPNIICGAFSNVILFGDLLMDVFSLLEQIGRFKMRAASHLSFQTSNTAEH